MASQPSSASHSRSAKAGGRSRLHRSVKSSVPRPPTRARASSTATVSIPTRWGLQQAVTSIAKRDTSGLYPNPGRSRTDGGLLTQGFPKRRLGLRSEGGAPRLRSPSLLSEGPSPQGGGPSFHSGGDRGPLRGPPLSSAALGG